MRTKSFFAVLALLPFITYGQFTTPQLSAFTTGYGSQGLMIRLDASVYEYKGIPVKGYIEGNFSGKTFDKSTINFDNITYSSSVNRFMIGIGGALSFHHKNIYIDPYFGLRYYYVRFKDKYLVQAIGENGIIRYQGNSNNQVGPTVSNAYGDAISIDIGSWIGFRITPKLELGTRIGFSPAKFSVPKSLFGEYWGAYPNPNSFYVKNDVARIEGAIKYYFN